MSSDTIELVNKSIHSGRFRNRSHLVDEAVRYYLTHLVEIDVARNGEVHDKAE
ncbi:MAG: hypothetical protein M0R06_07525 [Sphaerochaeta sp.]|nr:hypothetical protein [Sphaerochaeta sp.]